MAELLYHIATHPYQVLVSVLSVIAALAFLIFLWGFTGYILARGDAEHQSQARIYMVQGFALLLTVIIIWQILRWVIGFFT